VANVGATPVFVDITDETFNIDPAKIEEKITDKTKCIIVVHLFGQCADMNPIMDIARKHNIAVIEDTAQSLGARYKNKMAGTIGDLGCYSFFPSKNLGCLGDGGLVVSNDEQLADKVSILRLHGSRPKYYHSIVGTNSRLDTIQAAVLLVKLPYLNKWAQKRREHANIYTEAFTEIEQVRTPFIDPNCHHVFNQYTIRVQNRDELQSYLKENGIGSAIYYPLCLHVQECFKSLGYKEGDFPVAEQASSQVLSIPVYPELSEDQQAYVVQTIKNLYK
jgi:dTDP-4-amino-4,6-dideoxygalactose transaminase